MALDPLAFDALYTAHADAVYRSALGIVRDPDAASDVLQETFIRAFSATDEIAAPAAWLSTVARRLAIDELRKRARFTGIVEDAGDEDDQVARAELVADAVWADPAKSAATTDSVATAAACLDSLRPDDRTLLTLRYVEEQEIGAIASLLGRTVNATTVALHRARSRFDSAYADRVFARPGIPDACRAFRADALAHADGGSASPSYVAHLPGCGICMETDADLRTRSKAFAFAPLFGLPLTLPASMPEAISTALAAKGIEVGATATGAGAAGTTGTAASGASGSAATTSTVAGGVGLKVAALSLAGLLGVGGGAALVASRQPSAPAATPVPTLAAAASPAPSAALPSLVASSAPALLDAQPITTDGSPITISTSAPKEVVRMSFACTAGTRYGVRRESTVPSGAELIPPGTTFGAVLLVAPLEYGEFTPRTSGSCLLVWAPVGDRFGTATITAWEGAPDVELSVAPDGSPQAIETTTVAQMVRLAFPCTASTRYGIRKETGTRSSLEMIAPGATRGYFVPDILGYAEFVPSTSGTCHVVWDPIDMGIGPATITIWEAAPDLELSIAPDGAPRSVATTTPGQRALFRFRCAAGTEYTVSKTTTSPTDIKFIESGGKGDRLVLVAPLKSWKFTARTSGTCTLIWDPVDFGVGPGTLSLSR